jgi:hypothetical protein
VENSVVSTSCDLKGPYFVLRSLGDANTATPNFAVYARHVSATLGRLRPTSRAPELDTKYSNELHQELHRQCSHIACRKQSLTLYKQHHGSNTSDLVGPAHTLPRICGEDPPRRWLAQAPEVELPSACALFGCSGCRNFPVRGFRMMPRPHPWEPNQTPWFTESYSAQMRAKDAVAVTVQRVPSPCRGSID